MNVDEFKRTVSQTVLVPILVLLVVAGILVWQVEDLSKAQRWLAHSSEVTAQAEELQRLIIDQETGLRGYQLTGDGLMLAPYNDAAKLIPGRFNALRSLVHDNGAQSNRLAELYDRYQIWLAFSNSVLNLQPEGYRDPQLNLRGKQLMDDVRRESAAIIESEDQLRQQRSGAVQRQVARVLTIVLAVAVGAGILLALFTASRLRRVARAYQLSLLEARSQADEAFESRRWFETTLESIGDGVIACDAEGRIELMNGEARRMTGWEMDDARGLPLEEVFRIVNEETREPAENPVTKVQSLKTIVGMANHTLLIRRDGTELALDDSAAPIRDAQGTLTGIVLVFRDVTEKHRTQNALIATEKIAVAGRLAASIAHEIHNPLDSVANLHYLLWSETDPIQRDEYLRLAQQELNRALQISRAMLSLYREPQVPVQLVLSDLVEGVLLLLERKLAEQHAAVERRFDPVVVEGFPAELRQVFTNLIMNAVDAAGQGARIQIVISPWLATTERSRGALVEITDNGPGLGQDVEGKLFQPFFTTKGENGTGLGLWVSLGIVQKHGGTLQMVNSTKPGLGGATARMYLPARTQANPGSRSTAHIA